MAGAGQDPLPLLRQGHDTYLAAFNFPNGVPAHWTNGPTNAQFFDHVVLVNRRFTPPGIVNAQNRWDNIRRIDQQHEIVGATLVQMQLDLIWNVFEDAAAQCGLNAANKVVGDPFRYTVSTPGFTTNQRGHHKAWWRKIFDHLGYIAYIPNASNSKANRYAQCTVLRALDGSLYMLSTLEDLYIASEPTSRALVADILAEVKRETPDSHPCRFYLTDWKEIANAYRVSGRGAAKTAAIEIVDKRRKKQERGSKKNDFVDQEYSDLTSALTTFLDQEFGTGNYPSFANNPRKFISALNSVKSSYKFKV